MSQFPVADPDELGYERAGGTQDICLFQVICGYGVVSLGHFLRGPGHEYFEPLFKSFYAEALGRFLEMKTGSAQVKIFPVLMEIFIGIEDINDSLAQVFNGQHGICFIRYEQADIQGFILFNLR